MKPKKVFILSGPPASGKSTWIREHLTKGSEWISRDNVRFAIVGEDEDYFSHEDEVFDTFINYINQTLEREDIEDIYIDATHLNRRSRNKTLRRVNKKNIGELICVYFTTPVELCQARNSLRSGRALVPENVIRNMYQAFDKPSVQEGFDEVWHIDENDNIIKEHKIYE